MGGMPFLRREECDKNVKYVKMGARGLNMSKKPNKIGLVGNGRANAPIKGGIPMKNTGGTRSHAPKYIGIFVLLLILLCALPLVASASTFTGHICVDDIAEWHVCDICNEPYDTNKNGNRRPGEYSEYVSVQNSSIPHHIFYCTVCNEWHADLQAGRAECDKLGGYAPIEKNQSGYQHAITCFECGHAWNNQDNGFEPTDIENCKDDDKNNKCDVCDQSLGTTNSGGSGPVIVHKCTDSRDLDRHLCDDPDCSLTASGFCWDNGDADHECNECGQVLLNDCVDDDKDHYCDFCPNWLTTCNDARDDIDHLCDMCGGEVDNPEPCWDNTSLELDVDGHTCNAIGCGKKIDPSVKDFCWDYDGDGKCEECGWVIGSEPLPALRPEYRITVNGSDGKIERINETSIVYEDMWMRVSLGFEVDGQSYAVIAMVKVEWAEGQVGVLGYFDVPNVQGSGARTGASYLVMIDENADEITISGAVKDSFGMLIQ